LVTKVFRKSAPSSLGLMELSLAVDMPIAGLGHFIVI